MNRSADWLHQALADLELATVGAEAGHHEWACFACHQAVEKALKALYLQRGQQTGAMASAGPSVICPLRIKRP
ncbi:MULTISPECIES: HEPN domain-containing protein [unclassified Synechococcus]|uniref:HEPN domain-containing protein n=1 Tax=unclassified Synechococcus TaxID=2626047 RepID=UPI0021A35862|nr:MULTISPECIES: HEPN domain-containing protein [unclassified Synechococcus]